jgi:zinc D-Ala-D-Ala carboxypeptidase
MRKMAATALLLTFSLSLFTAGCSNEENKKTTANPPVSSNQSEHTKSESSPATKSLTSPTGNADHKVDSAKKASPPSDRSKAESEKKPASTPKKNTVEQVAAKPESSAVLVNKQFALPESYEPNDLVYPSVPFVFKEKIEKREMRKEAAGALEQMFKGAKKDGIYLAGVSAYRSHATQTSLFNRYVKKDGEEKAKTYSAVPGTSEHETGLAIDVSGSSGKCAATDCFAGTKEAKWLDKHAAEYGFIIRYPKGKESITGYKYEPWHLRYVGTKVSKEIARKGITLEEYSNAVPVSK